MKNAAIISLGLLLLSPSLALAQTPPAPQAAAPQAPAPAVDAPAAAPRPVITNSGGTASNKTAAQNNAAPADSSADSMLTIGPDGVPVDANGNPPAQRQPLTEEQQAEQEQDAQVADTDPSALTDFNQALDPYGQWVDDPRYGTVWVPYESAVGSRFAPYVSRGRWALTTGNQWMWVSDYPFGWVVFHYGRWTWAPTYGWVWVPGRRYAPAWVTFRTSIYGGAYIGWAPMAPMYMWQGGAAVWIGAGVPLPYVFCPSSYFFYNSVGSYAIYQRYRVRRLAARSRVYRPAHARRGYYYSPPLRSLGPNARSAPRTRVRPNSRAIAARRLASTTPRAGVRRSASPIRRGAGPVRRGVGPVGRSANRHVNIARAPSRRPVRSPRPLNPRAVRTRSGGKAAQINRGSVVRPRTSGTAGRGSRAAPAKRAAPTRRRTSNAPRRINRQKLRSRSSSTRRPSYRRSAPRPSAPRHRSYRMPSRGHIAPHHFPMAPRPSLSPGHRRR